MIRIKSLLWKNSNINFDLITVFVTGIDQLFNANLNPKNIFGVLIITKNLKLIRDILSLNNKICSNLLK